MTPDTRRVVVAAVLIALGIALGLGISLAMQRMQDLDRMMEARNAAPDKAKFDRDFAAMTAWFENYKRENPSATDEDATRAFEELWKK